MTPAHFFAKKSFRGGFQLGQKSSLRFPAAAVDFAGNFHPGVIVIAFQTTLYGTRLFPNRLHQAPSHKTLDRVHRVFRISHRLALGYLPDSRSPVLVMATTTAWCARLPGSDHHRFAALHHATTELVGSQVNSNNLIMNNLPVMNVQKSVRSEKFAAGGSHLLIHTVVLHIRLTGRLFMSKIIGIDLGTPNSVVAVNARRAKPVVIPNQEGAAHHAVGGCHHQNRRTAGRASSQAPRR